MIAHTLSKLRDRLLGEIAEPPAARAAAGVVHEVCQDRFTVGSMCNFGMEFHSVQLAIAMLDRRVMARRRARKWNEVTGYRVDLIAVAHPYFRVARHAGE